MEFRDMQFFWNVYYVDIIYMVTDRSFCFIVYNIITKFSFSIRLVLFVGLEGAKGIERGA